MGNESDHYILNYKKRLKIIDDLLKSWKSRYLSLKGKVTVINSLALPKILYLASVIHTPNNVIKELQSLVLDFLWDGKPPKIAYKTRIQPIESGGGGGGGGGGRGGGLKLCDVENKIMSVKVSWVKKLVAKDRSRWKTAPSMFYKTNDLNFFFKCNQAFETNLQPKFYAEILQAWGAIKNVFIQKLMKLLIKCCGITNISLSTTSHLLGIVGWIMVLYISKTC